jgi:hypothetical protein
MEPLLHVDLGLVWYKQPSHTIITYVLRVETAVRRIRTIPTSIYSLNRLTAMVLTFAYLPRTCWRFNYAEIRAKYIAYQTGIIHTHLNNLYLDER